ncbi:MAG: polysaccharide deacetylase family protein [Chitinophagaceae bacterium]|nr:polysaccharide deacetylase family protein [Chitinophagaceae bacterium]
METGHFVISLDFEIYWGVRDIIQIAQYKDNLLGVRKAIPAMLELFSKYNISATFATVGFLFFDNKQELLNGLPGKIPAYRNTILSPYQGHFNDVGDNEKEDPFHFAPSLIQQIQQYKQEIGCHTFSHYYCLEDGQTIEDFQADLDAAKRIAAKKDISLKSFVFPRNQYNQAYLNICKQEGITSFRGNEKSKLFSSKNHGRTTAFRRPFRLIDAYFNLSGYNCYSEKDMIATEPVNIPASRFLRPYSKKLASLDTLRLKRITSSMTHAARNKLMYHLWWHPHNFGINIEKNLEFLEKILIHYKKLSDQYNFTSLSMARLAELVKPTNER